MILVVKHLYRFHKHVTVYFNQSKNVYPQVLGLEHQGLHY